MRANEIIPTITVTKRFLEIIALIKVGKDARRFSQLMLGRRPKYWVKSWLNHKADIITIGTKLKYSITIAGKENFLSKINGSTFESHIANPQPMIVNKT